MNNFESKDSLSLDSFDEIGKALSKNLSAKLSDTLKEALATVGLDIVLDFEEAMQRCRVEYNPSMLAMTLYCDDNPLLSIGKLEMHVTGGFGGTLDGRVSQTTNLQASFPVTKHYYQALEIKE